MARGTFLSKAECTIAGLAVGFEVFRQVDAGVRCSAAIHDGERCGAGTTIAEVEGSARALLIGERTALNIVQRLSGIATVARRFVDASGGRITVLDTRKTTPTLRNLEKYAVRCGGATNHRSGLYDAVLIKDNHVRLAGGVPQAIASARRKNPSLSIEVEAETLEQVDAALSAGADIILADNMTTALIREVVRRAHGRARVEISGGVTLGRMAELAATGADYVSVGALTHSAPAIDISFEIEPV